MDNVVEINKYSYMDKYQKKVNFLTPEENIPKLVSKVRVFNEENKVKYINLIDEKILTIYLNSQEVLTALTVCDYPEYLAVGFLFNQNIISSKAEIKEVEFNEELSAVVVRTYKQTFFEAQNVKKIKTSGCAMGTVFGDMYNKIKPIPKQNLKKYSINDIRALVKEIIGLPSLYLEAGAIHGSVLCERDRILVYMEDVGRHNAIDKISGWIVQEEIDPTDKILYTTGRLTSEMVLKAISMGVPIIVSRSGFTKSAVHLARKFNLSMIGRFKGKRFMCVSGFERILL